MVTCADGYSFDSNMVCQPINSANPPTQIECQTGNHSDGAGNCIPDSIPVICDSDYHSDGNGNCIPDTVPTPSDCPYGY